MGSFRAPHHGGKRLLSKGPLRDLWRKNDFLRISSGKKSHRNRWRFESWQSIATYLACSWRPYSRFIDLSIYLAGMGTFRKSRLQLCPWAWGIGGRKEKKTTEGTCCWMVQYFSQILGAEIWEGNERRRFQCIESGDSLTGRNLSTELPLL